MTWWARRRRRRQLLQEADAMEAQAARLRKGIALRVAEANPVAGLAVGVLGMLAAIRKPEIAHALQRWRAEELAKAARLEAESLAKREAAGRL